MEDKKFLVINAFVVAMIIFIAWRALGKLPFVREAVISIVIGLSITVVVAVIVSHWL
jgi:hypothetical protein